MNYKLTIPPGLLRGEPDKLIALPDWIAVKEFLSESSSVFDSRLSQILAGPQEIIPILVDSYGGSIHSLLGMIDQLDACGKPICTYTTSMAMSCGAVLLSAGTKGLRYASPNATVMIHEAGTDHDGKVSDIIADTSELARLNDTLFEILAKNSNKTKRYYQELLTGNNNADLFLTAKEVKKMGLIDKIGVPKMTMEIKVSYKIT